MLVQIVYRKQTEEIGIYINGHYQSSSRHERYVDGYLDSANDICVMIGKKLKIKYYTLKKDVNFTYVFSSMKTEEIK